MYELAAAEQALTSLLIGLSPRCQYIGPGPLNDTFDSPTVPSIIWSLVSMQDTTATGGHISMSRPLYQIMVTGYGQNIGVNSMYKLAEDMHDGLQNKTAVTSDGTVVAIQREKVISLPYREPSGLLRQFFGGWYRLCVTH